jgi:hypothetical protein
MPRTARMSFPVASSSGVAIARALAGWLAGRAC